MPSISVVVVNWNAGHLLERCLRSVAAHAPGMELTVVDNASEDGSLDRAWNAGAGTRAIRNPANLGFAAGCNAGWRQSHGDPVLFLNPDAGCTPGSVAALAGALLAENSIWAAGGMLVGDGGEPQTGFNVRAFPTIGAVAAELLLLDEFWPANPWTRRYRAPRLEAGRVSDVEQPAGACLMVRRVALEALDGFDERFHPAWFEDVDLCRRIRAAGGRIVFQPEARFLHAGGSSLRRLGRAEFLSAYHTNQARYFLKHHGAEAARRVLRLAAAGMRLRAVLALARPASGGASRLASFRIFMSAARRFASLRPEAL